MESFSITSWLISIAQILFLLPLYVLIKPLSHWVCRHMRHGGLVLLYIYPYAISLMVLMGFISIAVVRNKLVNVQMADAYLALGMIKLSPFMLMCNIWARRLIEMKRR